MKLFLFSGCMICCKANAPACIKPFVFPRGLGWLSGFPPWPPHPPCPPPGVVTISVEGNRSDVLLFQNGIPRVASQDVGMCAVVSRCWTLPRCSVTGTGLQVMCGHRGFEQVCPFARLMGMVSQCCFIYISVPPRAPLGLALL